MKKRGPRGFYEKMDKPNRRKYRNGLKGMFVSWTKNMSMESLDKSLDKVLGVTKRPKHPYRTNNYIFKI